MRITFVATISLLFFCSCISTRMKMSLQEHICPLGYLFDSPVSNKKKDSVQIRVAGIKFNPEIEVAKKTDFFLPLLAINYRKTKFEVQAGESGLRKSYRDFLTESFISEGNRSGDFVAVSDSVSNGCRLELNIDSCVVKALYNRFFFALFLDPSGGGYFGFTLRSESAFPCMATIHGSARLWRGASIVMQKKYEVKKIQTLFPSDIFRGSFIYDYIDRQRFTAMRNLSEGLSIATKDLLEQVVKDANVSLKTER